MDEERLLHSLLRPLLRFWLLDRSAADRKLPLEERLAKVTVAPRTAGHAEILEAPQVSNYVLEGNNKQVSHHRTVTLNRAKYPTCLDHQYMVV